jgi:peroxiredoxin
MNKIISVLLFIPLCAFSSGITEAPEKLKPSEYGVGKLISDVTFSDIDGKTSQLSDYRTSVATVLFLNQIDCPLCNKYISTIKQYEKNYASQKINFFIVNVDATATKKALADAYQKWGVASRYLPDFNNEVAIALGAKSSTEVFVLDAARTLVYRGPIDDQYGINYSLSAPRTQYLKNALDAMINHKPIAEPAFSAPGCALNFKIAKKAIPITYYNQVSRILQRNCESCHRAGESAPFSLDSYKQAKSHGGMIRKVTQNKTMPPWLANPKVGEWANDPSLSASDIDALSEWFTNGMPEGDVKETPVPIVWPKGWNIGTPDVVYTIAKPISVPANGVMPYQYEIVQTSFSDDKWIQASEIRVTHPEVVHHVVVYEKSKLSGGDFDGFLAGKVPGDSWRVFPKGMAKKLSKNSELIFEIHYTPNGTAVNDQPQLGFVFASAPPAHEVSSMAIGDKNFSIPAYDPNYPVSGEEVVKKNIKLISFLAHMHLRGKAFQYQATYPDGKKELLLDIPKYDFNWQLLYDAKKPIEIPMGTKLTATGWFDNSEKNPANPDPSKTVKFGLQTFEEMMIGYIDYY